MALFVPAVTLDARWAFQALVACTLLYLAFFVSALCVYQARIYKNAVKRPLYIVDWRKSAMNRTDP